MECGSLAAAFSFFDAFCPESYAFSGCSVTLLESTLIKVYVNKGL
jgi:hypothetical protein